MFSMNGTRYIASAFNEIEFNELNVDKMYHCKNVRLVHSLNCKVNSDSSRIPLFARTRHRSELFRPLSLCTPSCATCIPGWNIICSKRKKTLHYFQSALQISKRSAVHLIYEFSRTYNGLIDILILLVG